MRLEIEFTHDLISMAQSTQFGDHLSWTQKLKEDGLKLVTKCSEDLQFEKEQNIWTSNYEKVLNGVQAVINLKLKAHVNKIIE